MPFQLNRLFAEEDHRSALASIQIVSQILHAHRLTVVCFPFNGERTKAPKLTQSTSRDSDLDGVRAICQRFDVFQNGV